MKELIAVAIGGAVGSGLRFAVAGFWLKGLAVRGIPLGTLAVNVIGSLVIGYLFAVFASRGAPSTPTYLFLTVGILGGFTTFSAFSLETLLLFRSLGPTAALLNITTQLILGLSFVWLGFKLGEIS